MARTETTTQRRGRLILLAAGATVLAALIASVDSRAPDQASSAGGAVRADDTATQLRPTDAYPIDVPMPVAIRLLAVRFNNPRLAIIDLDPGIVTGAPAGRLGLPGDAIGGALVMSGGDIVIWQDDTVRILAGGLDEVILEHTPDVMVNPSSAAPSFRVLPTADGQALWVVQIGPCCPEEASGLVELVDLTGEVRRTFTLPARSFPVATMGESLLLNTERLLPPEPDADEAHSGWSLVEPGSSRVLRLTETGSLTDIAAGRALTVSGDIVLLDPCTPDGGEQDCGLEIVDVTTGRTRPLERARAGRLGLASGPDVPGDFTPWDVVAPDGRILAAVNVRQGTNQKPTESSLGIIHPDTGEVTELARFDGPLPVGAWDRRGEQIVLVDGADIIVLDPTDGTAFTLNDVVPEDHYVVGIG